MSAFNVYNDVSLETGLQVFSSPWVIYRYMTANVKVIKTQSDPNSCDFPMGKTSSVSVPDSLKGMPIAFRFARATGGRTCTD